MTFNSVVISSGHGKYVAGASGVLGDEVTEARRVVERVATYLRLRNVTVETFHDDISTSQSRNLEAICAFHNAQTRELDVSVHFNAYNTQAHGTECWFYSQSALAEKISAAIASVGFTNRGGKQSSDLYFLVHTSQPSVLIEVAFCDSQTDATIYHANFDAICSAIATVLGGSSDAAPPPERPDRPERPPPVTTEPVQTGKVSWFGGPEDEGVSASEGLAFISNISQKPELFLPSQPPGTTGLARRLNPHVHFLAMRWDYDEHSKTELLGLKAFVRNPRTGFGVVCMPADWGPNSNTGRLVDVSQSVMQDLGLETDDTVEVAFPWEGT